MRLPDRFRVALVIWGLLAALFVQGCGGGSETGGGIAPHAADTTAPTIPQNLVATAVSPTQVDLAWSASTDSGGAGLAGYRVLRDGIQIATPAGLSYNDTGLSASTAYRYSVLAFDNATPPNVSASSAAANATTLVAPDTAPPSVPQNLTATAAGGTVVNLTWNASTDNIGVTGYIVRRDGVEVGTQTATSYSDSGLSSATTYSYTVAARDAANNISSDSAIVSATTADTIAPNTPTSVVATAAGATVVNLTWTASTDNVGVTGYIVRRNGVQVGTPTTPSFADTGLLSGLTYSYTVAARDAAGNFSPMSVAVSATTADTIAPSAPSGLVATAAGGSRVNLAWIASTDNVGVTGYIVLRNGAQVGTSTTTAYSDTGLSGATAYSYTVAARDAAGNFSPVSAIVSTTTADTIAPSTPTALVGTAAGATVVNLTWTASTDNVGVTGYIVKRNGLQVGTSVTPSFADTGLSSATTYSYTVAARDAANNISSESAIVSATTADTIAPTMPTSVVATAAGGSGVNLTWTASSDNVGVTGYIVRRNGVQVGTPTTPSFADTGLLSGLTYSYTVAARDAAGNVSPESAVVDATTADSIAPTTPTSVVATAAGATVVNLTWTASTDNVGVTGYIVRRNGVQVGTPISPSFADTGLSSATTYSYTVAARDAANNVSSESAIVGATTADTIAPTTPTSVVATAAGATTVNLTWTASTDNVGVSGYIVKRNGLQVGTSVTPSFADTGLSSETTYSYTVRAYDNATPANVSADSSPPASVTTPAAPDTTIPTVPQNVVATAISQTQVNLTWSASTDSGGAGLAGYRVLRSGTQIATTVVTTFNDTGLTASTTYSYTVRAYDNATPANVSADSSFANVTTPAVVVVGGLDTRPSNTTCLAGARPSGSDSASVQRVFPSLSFSSPVLALQAPGDSSRWFVVQQGGSVRAFSSAAGTSTTTSFIDITARVASGGELGLLGMAFHPNFPTDRRVFLSYTATSGNLVSRVSSFMTLDGGQTLDPTSEQILLTLNQPESNHNGGHIAFGPDGFLYIGFGDGGSGGDPHTQNGPIGNGQALTTMLGKMLRIDVGTEAATTYTIPSTNPFAANPKCGPATNAQSCSEIYAYGVRNPWRWSFDKQSGELWLGDVGQGNWEEVDIVVKGGNYGWRCREGRHNFGSQAGCPTSGLIDPVAEYDHTLGVSITGGYVYRGPQATALRGRYIFGDFGSGSIWTLLPDNAGGYTRTNLIINSGLSISSFAQANDGELYVVDYSGGLYRLVFQPGAGGGTIPTSLAATGCVDPGNPTRPGSGLIPYAVNAPFWSDGAVKDRWIALPNGQNITVDANSDWIFPNGTVLVKNFNLGPTLVETRLFMHHTDGSWAGYSYQWNDAQTDATLVPGGATKLWGAQSWAYPSEANCLQCHTAVAGRSLGLETAQMNRNFTYPQTSRSANQITTLNMINTLTPAIAGDPATLPAIPDPAGASGTPAERARSYLHTNCSQCHRPGGPTPVNLDLRYTTALNATNACGLAPQAGDLGLGAAARIIAPGSAPNSVLVARVNRRNDSNQMPPIGSNQIDAAGVALLTQWIDGLAGCN